jgi:hypothetical protein
MMADKEKKSDKELSSEEYEQIIEKQRREIEGLGNRVSKLEDQVKPKKGETFEKYKRRVKRIARGAGVATSLASLALCTWFYFKNVEPIIHNFADSINLSVSAGKKAEDLVYGERDILKFIDEKEEQGELTRTLEEYRKNLRDRKETLKQINDELASIEKNLGQAGNSLKPKPMRDFDKFAKRIYDIFGYKTGEQYEQRFHETKNLLVRAGNSTESLEEATNDILNLRESLEGESKKIDEYDKEIEEIASKYNQL